jgi:hypothetical protein
MSADDVVSAGLRGLQLGETVSASRTRACWTRFSKPTSPPSGGRAANWPGVTATETQAPGFFSYWR